MTTNTPFRLESLPFDPAKEAARNSREVESTEVTSLRQRDLEKRLQSMTHEEIEKLASDLM